MTEVLKERKIKAVLFDMDGTLIDTEKYFRKAWPEAAARFGYHMTDEQALHMRSLGRPFGPAYLRSVFGEDFDFRSVRDARKQIMEEYLKDGLSAMPGTEECLRYLKSLGVPLAVATSSDLERTGRYLSRLGLYSYFDRLISAVEVKEGKPSPDVYLYACRELGFLPEECIAVEDSPNGVLSAYRAGLRVVMVPDQERPDAEVSAMLYACLDSLADFTEELLR